MKTNDEYLDCLKKQFKVKDFSNAEYQKIIYGLVCDAQEAIDEIKKGEIGQAYYDFNYALFYLSKTYDFPVSLSYEDFSVINKNGGK